MSIVNVKDFTRGYFAGKDAQMPDMPNMAS